MAYLLGIDVGTSSTKAVVMDEAGRTVSCGKSAYDIRIPEDGYAEQDCETLWQAVCEAVRSAIADSSAKRKVKAVGVTGQMHGLVLLDKNKKPLRPVIIWADKRSKKQVEMLKERRIETRVGNPVSTGIFLPSLLWVKENEPALFERAEYAMLPKDYIRYRLCGTLGTDYSDATGTLLYCLKEGSWDGDTMGRYAIRESLLPQCGDSCEIAGKVSAVCQESTGLPAGLPVVYGGGDTPMQLVGNGIVGSGQLNTNIGTANQINCICSALPKLDPRINIFHHIPQDTWLAVGAGLNGGILMKWLQNNVFTGYRNFEQMSEAAAKSPAGAKGLVWLPFLNGERSPYMDENARAILFGMTLAHTREDIIRAAMESVVFSFRDCMGVFEELRLPMEEELTASGGGSKSGLWLQMQADILQKPIKVTEGDEDACKGAAIAAGVGCGIYATLEEGCLAAVRFCDVVYEPLAKNREVYENAFHTYLALYRNNKELFFKPLPRRSPPTSHF